MIKLIKDLQAGDKFEVYPGSDIFTVSELVWVAKEELEIVTIEEVKVGLKSTMTRWSLDTVNVIEEDPDVIEARDEVIQQLKDSGVPRELWAPVAAAAARLNTVDEIEQLVGSVVADH